MELNDLLPLLDKEIKTASAKYGLLHNSHEHYAVLQEEVDEWWDAVKGNIADCCQYELIQVAAVALRYVLERGDVASISNVQEMRYAHTSTNRIS